ncbi:MAG: sigma-70 family RNA polymerase sigma factor [Deltaproteobacteria bacterium]|nr:MAG: sigma-70 family RNA polymerase sigma factor [Deltaproteobacteria bacterium]
MGGAAGLIDRVSYALQRNEDPVTERDRLTRFETALLPHLDAAYDLARWLTRNDRDADDVVQEAYLRALRFIDGLRGDDGRAWLLTIVRRTCYTWLARQRDARQTALVAVDDQPDDASPNPEALLIQHADRTLVRSAIQALPLEFREVLVLRELENLSYKEIAAVVDVPLGTVMSRLARARERLHRDLVRRVSRGGS